MSLILSAELTAACNALGSYDSKTNTYYGDDNILETVKDLIRYLRRDNESHDIRRHFGDAKIVQLNLIPLLKLYWQQTDLFDVLLRLLGNLTSPVLLLYNEEIPKEKTVRNHFLQILGHLQSYKEAFADYDLWAVLCTRLSKLLNIEWHERGEENGLIIERILILVRNVLSVPADPDAEKRPDNDVSAHDKVLWSLRKSGLVDIIHYMVSSDQEENYYMYLLEILSLMLREHRPSDLANAASVRTESEKAADEAEFLSIRSQEMARKNERFRSYTSARHSRFGGTFVFKNVKSVNDSQELIYHKALNKANVLDFDSDKTKVKVPKNRRPLQESTSFRRSTFSIRLLLKDFCIEFLNAGYNKLMQSVRGKLVRGKSVSHDETYYLWALKFFMEFNRHYKFDVKLVSETMAIHIFHYVQQQMEHNFDMVSSDKKKWYLWSKRLHLAVLAYRELLLNLDQMDKSSDKSVRESSKVIKNNVFYVLEYREFLLTLMLTYNPQKMSDAYLLDLIETQHIFLKMLETFCGKDSAIVVQRRQKVKKKQRKSVPASAPIVSLEEGLEIKWDEISPQVSTVLEGGENIPIMVPFDAASDVPIDEQKKDAMIKIQDYLRENEIENAIGMLRAARDVWPDNDSFGGSSMTPEEEFLAIREIFFAKLRDSEKNPMQAPEQNEISEGDDEDDENDDDEEEEEGMVDEVEVDFKFSDFIKRFAHPKVIQALGLALQHFETNPVHVNHCILKLLHRVAWDCKMPAIIFQASIFRTFQRIFAERTRPQFKELVKFAVFIVRQFVKVAEINRKVFMELLFWKNSKEAYEVEEGYGAYAQMSKAMKAAWTEHEEEELRVLVAEYRDKQIEQDAVDWIQQNLVDSTKTRRMIIKKLKEMQLMDYQVPRKTKSGISTRVPREWEEREIIQLTELYNEFKDATDPLGIIVDRLDVKRPKNRVKQKLLELGLASDSKALRKKRVTKSMQQQQHHHHHHHHADDRDDERNLSASSSDELNSDTSSDESSKENKRSQSLHNAINTTNGGPSSRKKTSQSTRKKVSKPSQLDFTVAKKLIVQIKNLDMIESLKWIVECLSEAAEDQEQDINLDNNEGIPLVPIAENDILAMEHSIFIRFLHAIGIKKPNNEQEMYWRIPGHLKASELLNIGNIINETIEKGDTVDVTTPAPDAESSDEDVFDRLRKMVSKPITPHTDATNTTTEQSNVMVNNDNIPTPNNSQEITVKKKTNRIHVLNDSDDDDDDNDSNINDTDNVTELDIQETILSGNTSKTIDNSQVTITTKRIKSSRILNDSDDSEEEEEEETNTQNSTSNSKTTNSEIELSGKSSEPENLPNPQQGKKNKSSRFLQDSDESDVENNTQDSENNTKTTKISEIDNSQNSNENKKYKSSRFLEDSDDSNLEDNTQDAKNTSKRIRDSDSESEQQTKKKRVALIDSDED